MEMNEKLALRRAELATEAKNAEAEQNAINAKARHSVWGTEQPLTPELAKKALDAEAAKAISSAAIGRFSPGENATCMGLFLLGLASFFVAWWLAIAFIVFFGVYFSRTSTRYEQQIIAEGNARSVSV